MLTTSTTMAPPRAIWRRVPSTLFTASVHSNNNNPHTNTICLSPSALLEQRRQYSVLQKGHDVRQPTLFHKLGFGKDEEIRMLSRTPQELKLGLVQQVKRLQEDEKNAAASEEVVPRIQTPTATKKEKVKQLRNAYQKLSDPIFRAQYAPYHCSSVDVNLHVLCEGGQHCTNFNPEHETLDFTSASQLPQRSFGEFKEAFQQATNTNPTKATAHDARQLFTPKDGPDIQVTLHITFQEAMDGCKKQMLVKRFVKCVPCRGLGDQTEKRPRKCPQCSGKGTITLPSATYVLQKPCEHCIGKGTMPPPRCRSCRGTGTTSKDDTITVSVAPGTHTGFEQTLPQKGQCGTRGGKTGNLAISYLVEEHRWFHRNGLDLHLALPIPLSTALLGGYVTVPLLNGESKSVHIPANLKNGEIINVEGHGIRSGGEGAAKKVGALRIHTIVVIPKGEALTGQQKHALRSIARKEEPNAASKTSNSNSSSEDTELSFAEAKSAFRSWLPNSN